MCSEDDGPQRETKMTKTTWTAEAGEYRSDCGRFLVVREAGFGYVAYDLPAKVTVTVETLKAAKAWCEGRK